MYTDCIVFMKGDFAPCRMIDAMFHINQLFSFLVSISNSFKVVLPERLTCISFGQISMDAVEMKNLIHRKSHVILPFNTCVKMRIYQLITLVKENLV